MLRHLHIENYALITHLDIDFSAGFSTITGETGAGKSIIIGALGLLMGARADSKAITEGEQKCVIEAEFGVEEYGLESMFEEYDLDYLDVCTIRRELSQNGKSRSFVNDTPVTLAPLKELSARLIDIHSQHENLLLTDHGFGLKVVDSVAQNATEREAYSAAFKAYRETQKQLEALKEEAAESAKNADYVAYQWKELSEAQLKSGEKEELEAEEQKLVHAEEIQSGLAGALQLLDGEQAGVLMQLRECVSQLRNASRYLDKESDLAERTESAAIELRDIADTVNHLAEETEANPNRLSFVQERLDTLNSLLQKHHQEDVDALIQLRDELEQQIGRNDSFELEIKQLEKVLAEQTKQLEHAAKALSETRKSVGGHIKERLESQLVSLGIAHAQVAIELHETSEYGMSGKDEAIILFAANKNQTLRRVQDVASGGEIARLMLCIKALMLHQQPTIIFDEVDTGVSGEVASKMGEIMLQMASGRQIIAITHLPQIAAKGEQQYSVYKEDSAVRTETKIRQLDENERVTAIAKLLSGEGVSEAALENAKTLLRK
ncbi:MAG: DNA repair protein RecN [Bacteroidales bacterium]|jgi:DNA repair protein RecN (Recombination protein N)|nr:DNA repair protein RecN [Bacteroidales bacterium]